MLTIRVSRIIILITMRMRLRIMIMLIIKVSRINIILTIRVIRVMIKRINMIKMTPNYDQDDNRNPDPMCQLILVMHSDIVCIAKPHCKINFKSNHDDDDYLHLVHPHLPESEAHALLHIRPQLVLLLQHVARQQGRRRHRVVLLKIWSNYFTENATK